jgi:hypothetical protein
VDTLPLLSAVLVAKFDLFGVASDPNLAAYLVRALLVINMLMALRWVQGAIRQISARLRIHCFTIPY